MYQLILASCPHFTMDYILQWPIKRCDQVDDHAQFALYLVDDRRSIGRDGTGRPFRMIVNVRAIHKRIGKVFNERDLRLEGMDTLWIQSNG